MRKNENALIKCIPECRIVCLPGGGGDTAHSNHFGWRLRQPATFWYAPLFLYFNLSSLKRNNFTNLISLFSRQNNKEQKYSSALSPFHIYIKIIIHFKLTV